MTNVQLTSTPAPDNSHINIVLGGDITLANSSEITQNLIQILGEYDSIELGTSNITNIDISGIQIFYALRKLAETQHKKLRMKLNIPESNTELFTTAGIEINNL